MGLGKNLFRLTTTIVVLYDVVSDCIQVGVYYSEFGTASGDQLLDKVQFVCGNGTNVTNASRSESVARFRVQRTYTLYFIAASFGLVLGLSGVVLKWVDKSCLPALFQMTELPAGWKTLNQISGSSHIFEDQTVVEVIIFQLTLLFEDLPATFANVDIVVNTCVRQDQVNVSVFVIASAIGSALGAFSSLCIYSLHLFFVSFPGCFCGCIPEDSWTTCQKVICYPFIILLMVTWYLFVAPIYVYLLGIFFLCVCFFCKDRRGLVFAYFFRSLVMILAAVIFLLNVIAVGYAFSLGTPIRPEIGYKP